jgi:hypothetical protein
MYTILINQDDTITTSVRENIMHRSSMVNKLHILTSQYYHEEDEKLDMRTFTCAIEYVLPVSRKYVVEVLTPSENLYKEKLEYKLPIDTRITSEPGDVAYKFTFTKLEMDGDGKFVERSRPTSSSSLSVIPIERWDDYIASSDLSSIAQIMMNNQSIMEQQKAYAEMIYATKADNIEYNEDTNELTLTGNGNILGKVVLENSGENDNEEGFPVVDFNPKPDNPELPDDLPDDSADKETDNVVEF